MARGISLVTKRLLFVINKYNILGYWYLSSISHEVMTFALSDTLFRRLMSFNVCHSKFFISSSLKKLLDNMRSIAWIYLFKHLCLSLFSFELNLVETKHFRFCSHSNFGLWHAAVSSASCLWYTPVRSEMLLCNFEQMHTKMLSSVCYGFSRLKVLYVVACVDRNHSSLNNL